MKRLYDAFILPNLEYCTPLLLGIGGASESEWKMQISISFNLPKSFCYDDALKSSCRHEIFELSHNLLIFGLTVWVPHK